MICHWNFAFSTAREICSEGSNRDCARVTIGNCDYQTSSADEASGSGMAGIGTFNPATDAASVWLAGDDADLRTAVETQRMYLIRASGLFACSGFSSGLPINLLSTS